MKLLANENIPYCAVEALRALEHDVAWILEDSPGIDDREVLRRAVREARILLTQDKDFGELAFAARLPADCGVMLVRLPAVPPAIFTRLLMSALQSRTEWEGCFSVIELDRIRITPLPTED